MTDLDGKMVKARLNTVTGLITPAPKPKPKRVNPAARKRSNSSAGTAKSSPAKRRVRNLIHRTGVERTKRALANPNNMYLQRFGEMPSVLDDILTGVCYLHTGGTRPLRKGMLFDLMKKLDEISPQSVQTAIGCSESHSRRLAQHLRVAVTAFNMYLAQWDE